MEFALHKEITLQSALRYDQPGSLNLRAKIPLLSKFSRKIFRQAKIWGRGQVYLTNNRDKFHLDPI